MIVAFLRHRLGGFLNARGHEDLDQRANDAMLSECGEHVHGQEEQVLGQDGHIAQPRVDGLPAIFGGGFLDPRPGDVDVEKDEESAEAKDAGVEFVVGAA